MRRHILLITALLSFLPASYATEYNRTDYQVWRKATNSCLTTREVVMVNQGINVKVANCNIISGTWTDPYTGIVITDPKLIDIDHVISLHYAHIHGASSFSPRRKGDFGNDKANLLAVSQRSNRQKGDKGPADWLPRIAYRCKFVTIWSDVANKYQLRLDKKDLLVINKIKRGCTQ